MPQRKLNTAFTVVMKHGQLHRDPNLALNGAPKRLTEVEAVFGQTRREDRGDDHGLAFVGGKRPLDDEPNSKTFEGKTVPVGFGQGRKA